MSLNFIRILVAASIITGFTTSVAFAVSDNSATTESAVSAPVALSAVDKSATTQTQVQIQPQIQEPTNTAAVTNNNLHPSDSVQTPIIPGNNATNPVEHNSQLNAPAANTPAVNPTQTDSQTGSVNPTPNKDTSINAEPLPANPQPNNPVTTPNTTPSMENVQPNSQPSTTNNSPSQQPAANESNTAIDNSAMNANTQQAPALSQTTIIEFAQKAAVACFTYNYQTYEQDLQSMKQYFTQAGWNSFNKALTESNNLAVVQKEKLMVIGKVTGQAEMLQHQDTATGQNWQIQLPLMVIYQNDKQQTSQNLTVKLSISTVSTNENPNGFGIEQFIAMPAATTSTPDNTTAPAPK